MVTAEANRQDSVFAQLDVVDQLLVRRQYDQAMVAFLGLLHLVGGRFQWLEERRAFHHGELFDEVGEVCQRAAGQWQRLLTSDLDLARIPYNLLLPRLDALHALLMGTYQGSLDGFVTALHRRTGGRYQVPDLLRLMLAWCPNSRLDWQPFGLHRVLPQVVTAQAVATLCAMAPVSPFADRARERALAFLLSGEAKVQDLARFGFNPMVLHAWMRCSYADHPRKHDVKTLLGEMLATMTTVPEFELATPQPQDGKPVLLVPLESFVGDHAMFRCYANAIQAAGERFHTIGLGVQGLVDAQSQALFAEFEQVEAPGTDPAAFRRGFTRVQQLLKRRPPALVWYPGVGMHAFTVALAQRRLAPVQVMSLGHPASSRSPVMDYVMADERRFSEPSCFSEALLPLPAGCMRFSLPQREQALPAATEVVPVDGVVRVAVPSVAQKLGAGFIDALRRVEAACGARVRFVFFTGCRGALLASAVHNLRKELARADYHPWLDYDDYMAELGRCHIHAGTYPFGGTNSLVDSLRLGLPILAWEGPEAHSRIDGDFVRRAGLPEPLVCQSADDYVARLTELVLDEQALRRAREAVPAREEIDRLFHQQGDPSAPAQALATLL